MTRNTEPAPLSGPIQLSVSPPASRQNDLGGTIPFLHLAPPLKNTKASSSPPDNEGFDRNSPKTVRPPSLLLFLSQAKSKKKNPDDPTVTRILTAEQINYIRSNSSQSAKCTRR